MAVDAIKFLMLSHKFILSCIVIEALSFGKVLGGMAVGANHFAKLVAELL